MTDGLRTRARAARQLTVLTGLVFVILSASASAALPDPKAAVDQVLNTTTAATPEVPAQLRSSADETVATADETVAAAPPIVIKTVEAVGEGDVETAVGGTARALEDVGRQTTSRLDGAEESVSTLQLSPRVTANPSDPHPPTETASRLGGNRAELGAGLRDGQPRPSSGPPPSEVAGGLAELATADRSSMTDNGSPHAPVPALPGSYRALDAGSGDGPGVASSASAGRDGMHGSRAPAASAGAGGGTSAPPSIALALLLATLATPLFLRTFKEAPAFLRPAPYIALLERPG